MLFCAGGWERGAGGFEFGLELVLVFEFELEDCEVGASGDECIFVAGWLVGGIFYRGGLVGGWYRIEMIEGGGGGSWEGWAR